MRLPLSVLIVSGLSVVVVTPATAINRCTDANGNVQYQDRPCPAATNSQALSYADGLKPQQVIPIPDRDWAVRFRAASLADKETAYNGTDFQFFASNPNGFAVSIFVEPDSGKGHSAAACRQHYWALTRRNPLIESDGQQLFELDDFAGVTYYIALKRGGQPRYQMNMHYYSHHDGRCLDIHFSQVGVDPALALDEQFPDLVAAGGSLEVIALD